MLNTREKWQIQCGWCIVFVAASELPIGGSQYDILIQKKYLDLSLLVNSRKEHDIHSYLTSELKWPNNSWRYFLTGGLALQALTQVITTSLQLNPFFTYLTCIPYNLDS